MSEPYSGTAVQLVPGTLRGYRAWYLQTTFSYLDPFVLLGSTNMHFHWMPGPPRQASCYGPALLMKPVPTYEQHPSPVERCKCGYYATYQVHHVPVFREWVGTGQNYVIGSVAAHGKIVLGTRGFRAEYMKIESLLMDWPTASPWLSQIYDAVPVNSFDELLTKYPPSNVDELLGAPNSGTL